MPMLDPPYWPEPKSGCNPILGPMKLMMAAELGSTEAVEMSWFHRLSAGKRRAPFRLAPAPTAMALHAPLLLPPDPPLLLPPVLPPPFCDCPEDETPPQPANTKESSDATVNATRLESRVLK